MKRTIVSLVLATFVVFIYGQEVIVAEKERLAEAAIGIGEGYIQYSSKEEGFFSPNGPIVDRRGNLTFIDTVNWKQMLRYSEGGMKTVPRDTEFLSGNEGTTGILFSNQEGTSFYGGYLIFNGDGSVSEFDDRDFIKAQDRPKNTVSYVYPIPSGVIVDFPNARVIFSLELSGGKVTRTRTAKETAIWLPSQPGGFSLGIDGLLYRNGILWSAVRPKGKENYDFRYLGRLMSGHTIWCPGPPEVSSDFYIVDAHGNIELEVKIPGKTRFDYGLGPWGEFYYLFAPPMKSTLDPQNDYYQPEPGVPAELDVFRTHLKYFGRLNDGGVRLRKDPTTTADILGTYPAKTGFRIIEKGTREETIAGAKNVWYKVRLLDGKEGWFFGSFVANLYDGPNGKPPPWPNVPDW